MALWLWYKVGLIQEITGNLKHSLGKGNGISCVTAHGQALSDQNLPTSSTISTNSVAISIIPLPSPSINPSTHFLLKAEFLQTTVGKWNQVTWSASKWLIHCTNTALQTHCLHVSTVSCTFFCQPENHVWVPYSKINYILFVSMYCTTQAQRVAMWLMH